jgi:hypothetical protein
MAVTGAGTAEVAAEIGFTQRFVQQRLQLLELPKARTLAIGGSSLSADYNPQAFKQVDEMFKAKRYVTSWLNPPFEVDPAIASEIAEEKTRRAKAEADHEARQERLQAEQAERQAKAGETRAKAVAVLHDMTLGAWDKDALKAVFADLGAPLPWRWHQGRNGWDSSLEDANGDDIQYADVLDQLVMAAVNAAADLEPVFTSAADPDDGAGDDESEDDAEPDEADQANAPDAEPPAEAAGDDLPSYLTRLAGDPGDGAAHV